MTEQPRYSIIPGAAVRDNRLDGYCLRVLVFIGSYGSKEGWMYGSQGWIAKELGVSRPLVHRCLKELEDFGYVESRPNPQMGRGTKEYRTRMDQPENMSSEGHVTNRTCHERDVSQIGLQEVSHCVTQIDQQQINKTTTAATPARGHVHPLVERVIEAVGHPMLDLSKAPSLLFGGAILAHWVEAGIDLDETIIPAIAGQMARHKGGPVSTWNFYRGAVTDAHRIRMEAAKPFDLGEADEPAFNPTVAAKPAPQRRGPVPISDVFLQAEHRAREAERRFRGGVPDWTADESGGAHEGVSGGAALLTASGRI